MLSNPNLQDVINGVFNMVLLLELEFYVLTIMKKGAGHHPQPSKISLSFSAAV